ncbi:hypothetical protein HYPDE_23188 [Hyphomicrobium denitrificans 1NES1]|uniref:Uncharacterized protein n=1 Tax=Hyphomicrobium denitrificans 1NES1 TaxID=670307 RepID=N0AYW0_9HYPH|nr:hypothetical protein [Hyphomicrobium denitrificans]AGK56324.1 hypothetical protein HYPDE_23188 [Hyphomicrobium denitrificans 1NES1]
MPLSAFNPKLSKEAQEAVSNAFDAVAKWNKELGSSTENVAQKMAIAARAVGWPDHIVTAISSHVQSITQLHIHMMNHMLDAWQEQIKSPNPMSNFPAAMLSKLQSWPGLSGTSGWPSIEAFGSQGRFWIQIGEQWQKNWAQAITAWSEFGAPKK